MIGKIIVTAGAANRHAAQTLVPNPSPRDCMFARLFRGRRGDPCGDDPLLQTRGRPKKGRRSARQFSDSAAFPHCPGLVLTGNAQI